MASTFWLAAYIEREFDSHFSFFFYIFFMKNQNFINKFKEKS